jgi:hypothetical protein
MLPYKGNRTLALTETRHAKQRYKRGLPKKKKKEKERKRYPTLK